VRVTNIDTLSALFDRLISERIKLYHFENRYTDKEKEIKHQKSVIREIKYKIEDLFIECVAHNEYEYLEEKRSFGEKRIKEVRQLINSADDLAVADLDVGAAYYDQKESNSSPDKYMNNELKLREANERRASVKNQIDATFKKIVEKTQAKEQ
jgi:hypothetical protein